MTLLSLAVCVSDLLWLPLGYLLRKTIRDTSVNGQIIGFRYQLLEPLGQGSMGTVYKAIDRLTRQPVALKRVASVTGAADTEKSAKVRLTLADEFQTLASLHHPHVINVLD